jgi:hypothetical protein
VVRYSLSPAGCCCAAPLHIAHAKHHSLTFTTDTMKHHSFTFFVLLFLLCLTTQSIIAQNGSISGIVINSGTRQPLAGCSVTAANTTFTIKTDESGAFTMELPSGTHLIEFNLDNYIVIKEQVLVTTTNTDMGTITLYPSEAVEQGTNDNIPVVTLSEDEGGNAVGDQNISGVLSASRDVFVSAAAFNFSALRFRIRGYDFDNTSNYINGLPMSNLEDGFGGFNAWSGLNDVTRTRDNNVGLDAMPFAFGGVGGGSDINVRASQHRKQLRITYAISNRAYSHRLGATYSTGLLPSGWAVSLSAVRRWAQEGYIPGTFFDSYSFFAGVEKKISDKHSIGLTAFGSPTRRGRSGPAIKELYELTGTNYYNPYWGYQNGEKRNSNVSKTNQPVFILTHDWNITDRQHLTTSIGYQFGRNGVTALDWYKAIDPRPDYYRYMPSYIAVNDSVQAGLVANAFANDTDVSQIDWERLYNVNRNSYETIQNANGSGTSVSGNRAKYILEDRRNDVNEFNAALNYENNLTDHFTLQSGVTLQEHKTHYFKTVDDLLGADFYVDVDEFAERDSALNPTFAQNDITTPNKTAVEGDIIGYDYVNNTRKADGWVQGLFTFSKVDFFAAANLTFTQMWRKGNMENGKFLEESIGDSPKYNYLTYGTKGGITYKIDGRNYLYVNGGYFMQAPYIRNLFVSPRTRNQVVSDLSAEKIMSSEAGYIVRSPFVKGRLTGYYTQFKDQFQVNMFYLDNALTNVDGSTLGGFVNYVMTGINKQHFGMEAAVDASILPGFRATAVASVGQYTYTSRPSVSIYLDSSPETVIEGRTAYLKNFYVANTPQAAYNLGLNYRGKQFWFLNVNFNYMHRMYLDFFPDRRTSQAVSYVPNPQYQQEVVTPDSELWNQIINQQEAPAAFTMDVFAGKSFKIKNYFIYFNAGVNNVLNNTNLVSGGFEQYRFDYEGKNVDKFAPKYFYAPGINYYISLAFKL